MKDWVPCHTVLRAVTELTHPTEAARVASLSSPQLIQRIFIFFSMLLLLREQDLGSKEWQPTHKCFNRCNWSHTSLNLSRCCIVTIGKLLGIPSLAHTWTDLPRKEHLFKSVRQGNNHLLSALDPFLHFDHFFQIISKISLFSSGSQYMKSLEQVDQNLATKGMPKWEPVGWYGCSPCYWIHNQLNYFHLLVLYMQCNWPGCSKKRQQHWFTALYKCVYSLAWARLCSFFSSVDFK